MERSVLGILERLDGRERERGQRESDDERKEIGENILSLFTDSAL